MKKITIIYSLITLLMLLVILMNVKFIAGLGLWITYISLLILNINNEIKKEEQKKEIEKLKKEIIRQDVSIIG